MGNNCNRENTVAVIRAGNQIQGDIFTEAERVKNFSGEQRLAYEKTMAHHFGLKRNSNSRSAWDAVSKGKKQPIVDGMHYDRPSQIFSKKFYGAIDQKIEKWEKTKSKTRETYQQAVGSDIKKVIEALDSEITAAKNQTDLNRRLAKFGLTSKTVYHAKEYLKWLADGGHTQVESNPFISELNKVGKNIAKAQASFQMLWTLGNGADMQRVYSHYLSRKPSSVVNVVQGTLDAVKATNGQPWRRIPALEKAGIYGSEYLDRGSSNRTPFELSITVQKNLTYYLDKASGGNGTDGIRDLLFDSKPWDRPLWDRGNPDAQLLFGLARYPINESRWLFKTVNAARAGDNAARVNLLTYGLGRAFFFGTASAMPSWLLNKDQKEALKTLDDKTGANLVKHISRSAFKTFGIDAELDLSDYLSPLGGQLGSRAASLTTTAEKAGKGAAQGVSDLAQGKVAAAAARGVQTISAVANLSNWGRATKLLGGVNSTQVTDLADTLARWGEGEFSSPERLKREAAKDFLGSAVKKAE